MSQLIDALKFFAAVLLIIFISAMLSACVLCENSEEVHGSDKEAKSESLQFTRPVAKNYFRHSGRFEETGIMTGLEQDGLKLLRRCTFQPGTSAKRFVRDLSTESDLTEKQKAYLWKLVFQYRRQHKNKWFTYYAAELTETDTAKIGNIQWEI